MTIEFELGELRGTVFRSGNVDFNNRTDTYRFSTTRDVTDFFLQSTSTGASVEFGLYQDINSNGLIDPDERVDYEQTVRPGDIDYFNENLGRSSYIAEVKTDAQGRAASYTLRFGNLADAVVGLNSPASQPLVLDSVSIENPYDIYAFNVSSTGDISISLSGTTKNATLRVAEDVNKNRQLDSPDQELVNYSNTAAPGKVVTTRARVGAGDFLIQVSGDQSTDYKLSLSGPSGADLRSNNSSSASSGTVYRVYDFLTGAHFYTANTSERNTRITDGRYRDEGASFDSAGTNTVERFYNPTTQTYFYTINPAERDAVLNSLPNYQYQPGQGFQASAAPVPGSTPLYRFFNTLNGVHFYTPNAAEAQNVRNTLPNFRDEGVGFYVDPLG